MKVLSLFDGISCGMVALERAGITVERYDSFEIEPNAIKVSKTNYPNIVQHGSVVGADFTKFSGYDLLIGGSPCQDLCMMGSKQGLNGSKSSLFFEYARALKEVKPRYFLLENNASMSKDNRDKISEIMGCEPIMIDSSFFSAQTRKRLYWTNIPILPYIDKKLYLRNIYEYDVCHETVNGVVEKYVYSGAYKGRKIEKTIRNGIRTLRDKSKAIGTYACDLGSNTCLIIDNGENFVRPTQTEFERLQTLPDGYTGSISYKKAVACIGNGWTVDLIAHIFKGIKEEECESI